MKFFAKFCVKIFILQPLFQSAQHLYLKREDPDPEPDPALDQDPQHWFLV